MSGSEPGSDSVPDTCRSAASSLSEARKKHNAAFATFQTLVKDGIPLASFGVDDVHAEYKRLQAVGVRFTQPPVTTAVLDDTCGNLIQIAAKK